MAGDPYRYFRVEARDLLDQMSRSVLDLEHADRAADVVPKLLRLAHTLKGAARVVGQRDISEQAHAIEDLLAPLREADGPAPRELADALLKALDAIEHHLAILSAPVPDRGAAPDARAFVDDDGRTVRADVAEMDALLDGLAEARARLSGLQQGFETLERGRRAIDALIAQKVPSAPQDRRGDRSSSLAIEGQAALADFARGAARSLEQLDRDLRQARSAAERLRLVPAGRLFDGLERTVRDIAVVQGKLTAFEGRGGAIRLDAHALGAVQGAMVQLVRNAAAHGVEPQAERLAAGKPAAGKIFVEVCRRGQRIGFVCRDDGAGIRVDQLRQVASRKGLAPLTDPEGDDGLLRLLLKGGLSTSEAVTEVSGRGIGLELVREAADRLGGEVAIRTEAGVGTSVELLIPLSTASIEVLHARTPAGPMAIPLDAVRRILRLDAKTLARTGQAQAVTWEDRAIPFARLADLIGAPSPSGGDGPWTALIVEAENGAAAIGVERLQGLGSVVWRPLPDLAPRTPLVTGTILADDGAPQLVLDPAGLVAAAQRLSSSVGRAEPAPRSLLVIDDSLTTRMLEKSILELAGYHVDTANSAEEGLEQARRQDYALFLVDVEMPGMDGFSFIEEVRRDPEISRVPALLVTSCSSPEARRRGGEVGAQGYIVKSEFDQTVFLRTVEQLVN